VSIAYAIQAIVEGEETSTPAQAAEDEAIHDPVPLLS